jgi:hypothetical protein
MVIIQFPITQWPFFIVEFSKRIDGIPASRCNRWTPVQWPSRITDQHLHLGMSIHTGWTSQQIDPESNLNPSLYHYWTRVSSHFMLFHLEKSHFAKPTLQISYKMQEQNNLGFAPVCHTGTSPFYLNMNSEAQDFDHCVLIWIIRNPAESRTRNWSQVKLGRFRTRNMPFIWQDNLQKAR